VDDTTLSRWRHEFAVPFGLVDGQVQPTDFDLDEASEDWPYDNGRRAAENALKSWDFALYIQPYRSWPHS